MTDAQLALDVAPQEAPSQFETLWSALPKGAKQGKVPAERAFKRLTKAQKERAVKSLTSYYAWWRKSYADASWLHPSTYINQRRWEDEWEDTQQANSDDVLKFWADWINSDKPLPSMGVASQTVESVFAAGLVTRERIEERIG